MTHTDIAPIAELAASIKRHRQGADQACTDLTAATPAIIAAIRHRSGQSRKVEAVLWSCWNDDHQVNLCDALSGLDTNIAVAVLALISARVHLGGDADELLRLIIDQSGSHPPVVVAGGDLKTTN